MPEDRSSHLLVTRILPIRGGVRAWSDAPPFRLLKKPLLD